MSDRIRLRNPQKFNVGIITPDKPYGQNIAPGAFTIVTQDDIDYLMGSSKLLQKGILNFMSDEDIRKKLGMNCNALKKWLDTTEAEPYVLQKIAEIASTMNLSMNKVQLLQERVPNFEFIK